MKIKSGILGILICSILFSSCKKDEKIKLTGINLESALEQQFISFNVQDRNILLTDFKDNSGPFSNLSPSNFNTNTHKLLKRTIFASIPESQAAIGHVETFGLEFNQFFLKEDIDVISDKVVSNENFSQNFLEFGELNINYSNFKFQQTYRNGFALANHSTLKITNILSVNDHSNMIFISGEFYGSIGIQDWEFKNLKLSNGKFKVLIEN